MKVVTNLTEALVEDDENWLHDPESESTMKLWSYNPITGYWKFERGCESGTGGQWLVHFQKAEPNTAFKLSKIKPTGKPKGTK